MSNAMTNTVSSSVHMPCSTMIFPASSGKPNTPMKYDRLNSNRDCEVVPFGASLAARPLITE
ncbi:hypothetical protein D3C81_1505810 [compost metagenome]